MSDLRIVSLLPSATEIVTALGFADALVGRSHECDFPTGVERLPVCTEARIDASVPSPQIHRRVEEILSRNLSVYSVDAGLLRALAPTHIVTQVQCEVCAVSRTEVEEAISGWMSPRPTVVSLSAVTMSGVLEDIDRVAQSIGAAERGRSLGDRLRRRWSAVAAKSSSVSVRPRVATIEWLAPLMSAGNWMPEMVEMAGGINLFGEAGRHSPWLTWDELSAADPDVLVLFPCGFSLTRLQREIGAVSGQSSWRDLSAVRSGRVFLAEGNQLFNRPGPRLAETLETLAEIPHPELGRYGLEGTAWMRLVEPDAGHGLSPSALSAGHGGCKEYP